MNILIKLMSIVSLVIAPHIAVVDHHDQSMNQDSKEIKVEQQKSQLVEL